MFQKFQGKKANVHSHGAVDASTNSPKHSIIAPKKTAIHEKIEGLIGRFEAHKIEVHEKIEAHKIEVHEKIEGYKAEVHKKIDAKIHKMQVKVAKVVNTVSKGGIYVVENTDVLARLYNDVYKLIGEASKSGVDRFDPSDAVVVKSLLHTGMSAIAIKSGLYAGTGKIEALITLVNTITFSGKFYINSLNFENDYVKCAVDSVQAALSGFVFFSPQITMLQTGFSYGKCLHHKLNDAEFAPNIDIILDMAQNVFFLYKGEILGQKIISGLRTFYNFIDIFNPDLYGAESAVDATEKIPEHIEL